MPDSNHKPSVFCRLTSVGGIILVVLLNLLGASPRLHAHLHNLDQASDCAGNSHKPVGDADHECGVTIFSHGAPALLVFGLWLLLQPLARGMAWLARSRSLSARLRYWHVPAHAPP